MTPPAPPWGHDFEYPEHFETLRVSKAGTLPWGRSSLPISTVLRHELLGFDWNLGGWWDVFFGSLHMGTLCRRRGRVSFFRNEDAHP